MIALRERSATSWQEGSFADRIEHYSVQLDAVEKFSTKGACVTDFPDLKLGLEALCQESTKILEDGYRSVDSRDQESIFQYFCFSEFIPSLP